MVYMDKEFVLHDDGLRIGNVKRYVGIPPRAVQYNRKPDLWIGFLALVALCAIVWWVTK
jgi:hypothetical protein